MSSGFFIYFGLFIIALFFIKLFDLTYEKNKIFSKVALFSVLITLTISLGFRYQVGTDYQSYIAAFNGGYSLDIGSRIIFGFSKSISTWPQLPILIYAALNNIFLALSIYEMKKGGIKPVLPMAIFLTLYFPFSFNIIRQGLAISMLLYAFLLYFNKHKVAPLIIAAIAAIAHNSAIIALPFLITLSFSKQSKYAKRLFIVGAIAIFLLLIAPRLTGRLADAGITSYVGYFNRKSDTGIDIELLVSYTPVLAMLFASREYIKKDIMTKTLTILVLFGITAEVAFSFSPAISRIGLYFSMLITILLPRLLEPIENVRMKRFVMVAYYVYLILYFVLVYYMHGRAGLFPYQNLLFMG